jgi:N-dimethylarginine dimethylaminohydrolase
LDTVVDAVTDMLDEVSTIGRMLLRHPRDAFVSQTLLKRSWRRLNYLGEPDFRLACAEYDRFVEILEDHGIEIAFLGPDPRLTPDALYVRDSALLAPDGLCLAAMGKPERAAEVPVLAEQTAAAGCAVAGRIQPPGLVEGGDLVWLNPRLLLVGHGYRTNAEGIRQLAGLMPPGVEIVEIPLPHFRGPDDVFHLMSVISPVDHDLAVVHSPLMPVPFRNRLLDLGMRLVEVHEAEFETLGGNVLALAPGRCVMVAGNPKTRAALEHAGAQVVAFQGAEICLKGSGGPTCLTRPLTRSAA